MTVLFRDGYPRYHISRAGVNLPWLDIMETTILAVVMPRIVVRAVVIKIVKQNSENSNNINKGSSINTSNSPWQDMEPQEIGGLFQWTHRPELLAAEARTENYMVFAES